MLVDFEGSFASFRWTDFVFFDVRHPTTGAHSMQLDKSVFFDGAVLDDCAASPLVKRAVMQSH